MTNAENRAQAYARAVEVLGSSEKADRWLSKPLPALGGQAPEALLETDEGTTVVLQVLGRIDHRIPG